MTTELSELDRFLVRGSQMIVVKHVDNRRALVGQTVTISGTSWRVTGFESCLIPSHDEGECRCFGPVTVLAVR